MAVTWKLIFTDRVTITPKATLGDGTEVTDYANSMVMEVQGTSGEYSAVRGQVVGFARPDQKTAADYVPWLSLSASKPAFIQPLMDSFSGSVTADVVTRIRSQFNSPIPETVPSWAQTE